jgi:hypothetical protein
MLLPGIFVSRESPLFENAGENSPPSVEARCGVLQREEGLVSD